MPLSAQDRGASLTVTGGGRQVARFGDARALVIGESDYTNGWARLSGVKDDVRAVKRLFEEQGFAVQTLENAPGRALRDGIEHFLNQYGHTADTRIVIYYAGHGETLQLAGGKMGYIVPVDAPLPSSNREGFLRSALPMNQFQTWAEQYDCRHIIFIFDSCFSGTVFTTPRGMPPAINENISRHVRQFITSGAENETVPDKSVFRTQLEAALREGEADLNRDGYVSGTELGMFLEDTVVNYSRATQHPKHGKIRNPNLDKGDFIFAVGTSLGTQDQPVTQPAPAPQPASRRPSAASQAAKREPEEDKEKQSAPADDKWKNKWIYLGGILGGGYYACANTHETYDYTHGYLETSDHITRGGLAVFGFQADFWPLKFLALEVDLGLGVSEYMTLPVIPLMAKFGGRPGSMELTGNIGYTIGAGFTIGATVGFHAGPGVFSVELLFIPEGEVGQIFVGMLGYKVGLGNKK